MLTRILTAPTLLCSLALAACQTGPNPAAAGLSCNESQLCAGTITITSPGPTSYANRSVTSIPVRVAVSAGPQPAAIQIRKNSMLLATVTPPSYSFDWNITTEADGTYQISALAQTAGVMITAAPVTVMIDRTAPMVTSQVPAPGATGVSLSDPIRIVFSEPLAPSTVTTSSVTLSAGATTLPATSALSADGTKITVSLRDRSSLTFPATVTVTLATTIADVAGNTLSSTPPWSWTAPLWVELPVLQNGDQPSLALDAADQPVVAAVIPQGADGAGPFTVSVLRYATGTGWIPLASPSSASQGPASLAVDPSGAPIVAWSEAAGISVERWTGSSWDSTTFSHPEAAFGPSSGPGLSPVLAVDHLGLPVLAWTFAQNQMSASLVYVARSGGSVWQSLSANAIDAGPVTLRLDSTGAPIVSANGIERYVAGSWLTLGTTGIAGTRMPHALAVDAADRPVIVTVDSTPAIHVLVFESNAWTDLGGSGLVRSGKTIFDAQVVISASGKPVIVWSEGSPRYISVARWTGTAWDQSFGVLDALQGAGTDALVPKIVLDSQGSPVVAWAEGTPLSTYVAYSSYVWKSNH